MTLMRRVRSFDYFRLSRIPLAAWLLTASAAVFGQTTPAVSTVFAFSGTVPNGGLVQGPDGGLYGTTSSANVISGGLIYRSTVDGSSVKTLHQLTSDEGYVPKAGLVKGSDGLLYGSTRLGMPSVAFTTGTIYRLGFDGILFEILHRFGVYATTNINGNPINLDGAYPESAMIEGSDGFLYGVTRAGGVNGTGVVFRLAHDGTGFSVVHTFGPVTSLVTDGVIKNIDGSAPVGQLVQTTDGYLYGTTSVGGASGRGTIFRIQPDGTGFAVMHEFTALSTATPPVNVDGANPLAGLTDGGNGLLYGVASQGGPNGVGTLFSLDPNVEDPDTVDPDDKLLHVLHNFDSPTGANPSGELIVGLDSRLYGVTGLGGVDAGGNTTNFGTIYSIALDGTDFTRNFSFNNNDGYGPYGPLLQIDATTFVGIAAAGGKCNQGTLFSYSSIGDTVTGNKTCGQKKNNGYGGGSIAPGLLMLLGTLGLARRRRSH